MRVRVSELALSVVTCQPLIVAAVNIYTSSLSAPRPVIIRCHEARVSLSRVTPDELK